MIYLILTFLASELAAQGFSIARLADVLADYFLLPYRVLNRRKFEVKMHFNSLATYRQKSTPGVILKFFLK